MTEQAAEAGAIQVTVSNTTLADDQRIVGVYIDQADGQWLHNSWPIEDLDLAGFMVWTRLASIQKKQGRVSAEQAGVAAGVSAFFPAIYQAYDRDDPIGRLSSLVLGLGKVCQDRNRVVWDMSDNDLLHRVSDAATNAIEQMANLSLDPGFLRDVAYYWHRCLPLDDALASSGGELQTLFELYDALGGQMNPVAEQPTKH